MFILKCEMLIIMSSYNATIIYIHLFIQNVCTKCFLCAKYSSRY